MPCWTSNYIRMHVVLQIEDLNEEIKLSGVDKSSVLASLRDCKSKLEESEMLRDRLTSRMDTLFKKIESEERERETLLQQMDRLNEKVILFIVLSYEHLQDRVYTYRCIY